MISRDRAVAFDAADPLARWRNEFVVTDPDLVYLDGNSLGMTPRRAVEAVNRVMTEDWATGLTRSWEHWVDLPRRVGATLAPCWGSAATRSSFTTPPR